MTSTIAELTLSGPYRHAQRILAAWLEQGQALARRRAFAVRVALAALNATERHRMARWLAWLAVAAESRRQPALLPRIRLLDAALGQAAEDVFARLPVDIAAKRADNHRLTA
ncbi:hypothetical protein ABZR86_17225 [Dyella marensis]|jgi:hypothetical protein|uniref:Uncharacterized protein n=1 Tax=Dyella marensis TaxID=500610 RepID=A0A1I2HRG4_9GAMM|nr:MULTISPECIES: hypothetical protein [Dyella]SFF31910.1 hypothetical protein SAMN02799615_03097 [Dyella marensis]